jgi:hypothetical protein
MIKKAFKIIGILLLVVVITAIAVPYFFKDKIVASVKEEINKNVNAQVDFGDVSLSLLRSFPDFNFSIDDLSITGIETFEGVNLVSADNVNFSLDLMSVINGEQVEINAVNLVKPNINIQVLRNGQANYDIAKPVETTDPEAEYAFQARLQEYSIEDGTFVYNDIAGDIYVNIQNLNHEGSGAFTQDVFDLITTTQIGSFTAASGGVSYLTKAKTDIDLTLNADIPNATYTIKDNKIQLNALTLIANGFVQLLEDRVKMEIQYAAPENNFKNFLSLIPSAYTADYKDVQANGSLQFNGFVRGDYNLKTGALPAFQVNLKVDNADFKYPDLPLGVTNIATNTVINSPSSDLDKMTIDVNNFKMQLGNNPFEATLKLRKIMSDPYLDSKINGVIDLAELSKAFPMEGVQELNGVISSNLIAKTSMSAIDKQDYENIDMSGDLRIEGMNYKADDIPLVNIKDMQLKFTPKNVELNQFDAVLGRSDVQARGTIDNIMAFFAPDKTMTGNIVVRSQLFDSNEWLAAAETEDPQAVAEATTEEYEIFDQWDFNVDGEVGQLFYDVYELKSTKLRGQVTPNKAEISNFETKIGESDFKANGTIRNMFVYMYENGTMTGDVNLVSDYINLNEFMAEVPTGEAEAKTISETATDAMGPVLVPEKMDFDINADINRVLYTNINLKNIDGKVKVANETVSLKDCSANTLGGNFTMNGSYDTSNPEAPAFDMDYKVNRFDFQDAFNTLNTFEALAPIGKFIEGQFNTNIKMSGILDQDMYPKLNTLSASGIVETLNSSLKNFAPLVKLGEKLNLGFFQSVDLKNTINSFEVNDGKVTVKPFELEKAGIKMNIAGSHGFDTDMDYTIKAAIPRELLQKGNVGQAADKGLKFLSDQASKLGINIDEGAFVNIAAQLSGTIKDPKVKVNLLGADGEIKTVESVIGDIKDQAINKAADVVKDKTGVDVQNIEGEIKDAKEDLSAKADAEIAALTEKTDAQIKNLMDEAKKRADQARAEAKKLSERTETEGYKQADQLVEQAGSNIFKKKAAEVAAKKLKEETDKKVLQIIEKGDDTAEGIIQSAEEQADKLRASRDKQAEAIREKYKE